MRPTQRSLLARQRNSSFDGGWNEHSLRSAMRMTTFHRNAEAHKQIFNTERKMFSRTPYNPFVQNNAWVVVWLPSPVRFTIFPYQNQIQCLPNNSVEFRVSLVILGPRIEWKPLLGTWVMNTNISLLSKVQGLTGFRTSDLLPQAVGHTSGHVIFPDD